MFCSNCGKEINDGVKFCSNCGSSIGTNNSVAKNSGHTHSVSAINKVRCPVCGGDHLHALSENDDKVMTTGGGYSGTKGCLGYIIFGPLGLLCGSCGSKEKTTVIKSKKLYWVCQDCGNKFRNEQDLVEEEQTLRVQKQKVGKLFLVLGIIELICSFVLKLASDEDLISRGATVGFILGVLFAIIGVVMLVAASDNIEVEDNEDEVEIEDENLENQE